MPEEKDTPESRTQLKERVDAAKDIVAFFLPERIIHLSCSTIIAGIVIFVGVQVMMDPAKKMSVLITLFGTGGVVGLSIARLLTMFTKVIEEVFRVPSKPKGVKSGN